MTYAGGEERARLRAMIDGYQVSQAVAVAATLGIADLLAAGPRSVAELAGVTGTHRQSLRRLMRALAAVGVFAEVGEGGERFGLTALGEGLRSDVPGSSRAVAIQAGQWYIWAAWSELLHSVRTGEPAFRHVHGVSAWAYRERHPAAGEIFDRAMAVTAAEVAAAIVGSYGFADAGCVVDVGGGRGGLLAAILAACPGVRGVLFDRSQVVVEAEAVLREADVLERCSVEAGDFFAGVPGDRDLYLLKGVIHDWDDADAGRILRSCRRAMGPGSKLLVIEQVVPVDRAPEPFTLFMDLHMMVIHGAAERTEEEFAALLESAGFRLERVVPVLGAMMVLEAVPV
jgi:SAM-dependent methyltransferase